MSSAISIVSNRANSMFNQAVSLRPLNLAISVAIGYLTALASGDARLGACAGTASFCFAEKSRVENELGKVKEANLQLCTDNSNLNAEVDRAYEDVGKVLILAGDCLKAKKEAFYSQHPELAEKFQPEGKRPRSFSILDEIEPGAHIPDINQSEPSPDLSRFKNLKVQIEE